MKNRGFTLFIFAHMPYTIENEEEGASAMLPKPNEKFDLEAFQSPDSFHRPAYMWCWNSPITAEMLTAQLRDLYEAGGGGVMIVPEPPAFRPRTMRTTLEPDYLTDGYFEIYRAVTEEAARLGMKIWFYDEGGWPSGSACGKVTKKYPHLATQRLAKYEREIKQGEAPAEEGALAIYLYTGSAVIPAKAGEPVPAAGILASIVIESPKGDEPIYPDLLNEEAVKAFIGIGCEPYLPHIGRFAGCAVPLLFTDEPKAANPPWSVNFAELFEAEKGYDITPRLNELFETGEDGARTRIDFFDFWSKRFAKSFFAAMRAWCNQNGMAFGGHLAGDDALAGLKHHGYGHALRMFREMDIPGIDCILRQIFPGGRKGQRLILDRSGTDFAPNYHYPRWASSVARQQGHPWSLSESFAVYGQGLTPAEMKWIVNYQLVRGITLFCPATLASSVSGPYMANERPVFTPAGTMWQCLKPFNDYTARLSYLLSLGKPDVRTALYMPVRDVWSKTEESEKVMAEYDRLAEELEKAGMDFDVVDDDALETAGVEDGRLQIGAMFYETVVVPRCRYMTNGAAEKLKAFEKAGGQALRDTRGLRGPVSINPAAQVSVTKRLLDGGALYLLVNEGEEAEIEALFPEKTAPVLLDAVTGKAFRPRCVETPEGVAVTLKPEFAGCAALLFGAGDATAEIDARTRAYRRELVLEGPWRFRKSKGFVIGENEFETREYHEEPAAALLGPWAQYAGEDFSGEGVYEIEFRYDAAEDDGCALLSLGKVDAACRCRLNGRELGLCPWPPYEYDISGLLANGTNRLEVTVINTPANQYIHTKEFDKWEYAEVGRYHKDALVFERESVAGGLFGKVRIYAG